MGASVTILEATAPVKLPTCHCPASRSGRRLGLNLAKGGIPRLAPPRPEPRLRSLPPILCMVRPNPMASYSKAPRGLSVQLRVTRVFTGRTTSPSLSSRQRSARYAIRAGRNFTHPMLPEGVDYTFISTLGYFFLPVRLISLAITTIRLNPSTVRCSPRPIISQTSAKTSKSRCFIDSIGYRLK